MRNASGQFQKGWKGGPGRPKKQSVADLCRHVIEDQLDEETVTNIVVALIEKAEGGDLKAIKTILEYVLGKPRMAAEEQVEISPMSMSVLEQAEIVMDFPDLARIMPYEVIDMVEQLKAEKQREDATADDADKPGR